MTLFCRFCENKEKAPGVAPPRALCYNTDMMIKKINVLYFSATGTTKKVASKVAEAVRDGLSQGGAGEIPTEFFNVSQPQAREKTYTFGNDELLICAFPVNAGRIPNLLLPFVKGNIRGEGAFAIEVVTFGNRAFDDALIEMKMILEENGFTSEAAGAFSCRHSFSEILGAGRPDEEDLKEAETLGKAAAEKLLKAESDGSDSKAATGTFAVDGNPELPGYYRPQDRYGNPINILKVVPKTDMSKCKRCFECAKVCTMGSISFDDPAVMTGKCIKCNACLRVCPTGAKYFDDPGYILHKTELEEMYAGRRAENRLFY